MADYADTEAIEDYLPEATEDTVAAIGRVITRASRAIDAYTRRNVDAFAPSPEVATEALLYGTGETVLETGAFVAGSVESVTDAAGRTVLVAEYRGALRMVDAQKRFTNGRFERGAPFAVTARFGFAFTPPDITEACLQLATRWWRAKDEAFSGVVGSINRDGSIIERSFPPAVKQLLEPYVLTERADETSNELETGDLRQTDFYPEDDGLFRGRY